MDTRLNELRGARVLVVASTGGHLAQAMRWAERLGLDGSSHVVTFDSEQSRSLLGNWDRTFVPYVAPRDWRGVARLTRKLVQLQFMNRFDAILSTGAGVALSCLPVSYATRTPYYFLESVSRFEGPSLSGRILQHAPLVRRGTQHLRWSGPKWPYVGSLLDEYAAVSTPMQPDRPLRIFVSLGTIRPYRFDRLVDSVLRLTSSSDEVTWQLGATTRDDLPGQVEGEMSRDLYAQSARDSDVVITHSGVGAVLDLLEMGISPIVVPRRASHGEHVDDHQLQVATDLHDRGLVSNVDADQLSRTVLLSRARITRFPQR